jgi:hypothetical protein
MSLHQKCVVIGLTGPIWQRLYDVGGLSPKFLGYHVLSMSALIRAELEKAGHKEPDRAQLQTKGNEIRNDGKNPGALAKLARLQS